MRLFFHYVNIKLDAFFRVKPGQPRTVFNVSHQSGLLFLYLRSRSRRHRESPGSALCRFKRALRRSMLLTEVPEVTTNAR